MNYSIFSSNVAPFKENAVLAINRRAASVVARKFNVTTKLEGFTRKFYVNNEFIGSVNCYPSNNGKFFATSKTGYINGEGHAHLFHTFEGALRFALNAVKVTYKDIESIVA